MTFLSSVDQNKVSKPPSYLTISELMLHHSTYILQSKNSNDPDGRGRQLSLSGEKPETWTSHDILKIDHNNDGRVGKVRTCLINFSANNMGPKKFDIKGCFFHDHVL